MWCFHTFPGPSRQPNHPWFALPKVCFSANTPKKPTQAFMTLTKPTFLSSFLTTGSLGLRRGGGGVTLATRAPWAPHEILMAKRSKEKARSSESEACGFFRLVQVVEKRVM
ncbi:hypothetical protein PsorP6_011353 [Peronosclerospora sorghi]|uniref:Uncharacterized protein n=1 Tax=Peronosclerospora sorghi TaxID=230839 RepID=A0ACC0WIV6_9STRA|nr:hypothetical protein PsorP6_011353 [Peronosclerospora sorghi]